MADEYRSRREEAEINIEREAIAKAEDPDAVRAEIEMTRARMSETIDEIEGALVRRKEEIRDRLDILSPIKDHPLPSLGVALGLGIVVGIITGGDDDDEDEYEVSAWVDIDDDDAADYWRHRADMWETRARRLLRIAREQEDHHETYHHHHDEEDESIVSRVREGAARFTHSDEWSEVRSELGDLQEVLKNNISNFVTRAVRQMVGR